MIIGIKSSVLIAMMGASSDGIQKGISTEESSALTNFFLIYVNQKLRINSW